MFSPRRTPEVPHVGAALVGRHFDLFNSSKAKCPELGEGHHMKKDTSWNKVAPWYDDLIEGESSYQSELILPNLLRLFLDIKNKNILDLACGQGFFARAFSEAGASVTAIDAAPALIDLAKTKPSKNIEYHVARADVFPFVKDASVDITVIVLAIQNIENIAGVFKEVSRVLKPNGKFMMVLNHPAFRIPKESSWGWDDDQKMQYRRIDQYLSESRKEIVMHPGEKNSTKTISFHRPLQVYMKALVKAGFVLTRLEEWNSHKKCEKGPRQEVEDRARKEIPLFLFMEAQKSVE